MNAAANDGNLDESALVKLYMDLTGTSEACARGVYMFVCSEDDEKKQQLNGLDKWRTEKTESQKAVVQSSRARDEDDSEFGIGFLGRESLAITGK